MSRVSRVSRMNEKSQTLWPHDFVGFNQMGSWSHQYLVTETAYAEKPSGKSFWLYDAIKRSCDASSRCWKEGNQCHCRCIVIVAGKKSTVRSVAGASRSQAACLQWAAPENIAKLKSPSHSIHLEEALGYIHCLKGLHKQVSDSTKQHFWKVELWSSCSYWFSSDPRVSKLGKCKDPELSRNISRSINKPP